MELALNRRSADGSYSRREPLVPVALAVTIGGALGALARYGLDSLIERRTFSVFPWSTLLINASGCFAAGLVVAALVDRHHLPVALRIGLVVGFLGAYTTFSTFAQETVDLAKTHDYLLALANAAASVSIGLAAVVAGTLVGRML
jgi:CrcB protein